MHQSRSCVNAGLLSHHGNVMYSPLYTPEGMTPEQVWEKAAAVESSNYAPGDLVNLDIVSEPLYIKRHLAGMCVCTHSSVSFPHAITAWLGSVIAQGVLHEGSP